jgi:CPA2 family monovalent cation:H+ antiporter-2/glutathione-regulated potassium-efflux system protein KefB
MEDAHAHGHNAGFLLDILVFIVAAVVAVPLFRLIGLSAVLGYLVAGIVIGPSGLSLFKEPGTLLGIAELGVVMFLFVIGLELKLSELLSMRRNIAVLGAGQMIATTVVVAGALKLTGLTMGLSTVVALALSLSATAIALQLLEERGALQTPYGQRAFAVLLFQDMAIVPILALLPVLAGKGNEMGWADNALQAAKAVAALGALVLAGRYLLNPLFRMVAWVGARELMTSAALLVVLGSAVAMQMSGMSMALGAFLAGLMLAESNFRHQLEADIEPFRGLLLGLFFMSVGMSIDGRMVLAHAAPLLAGAVGIVLAKLAIAYGAMRAGGAPHKEALSAAAVLTPAGEFAFVLLPLAATLQLATREEATLFSALAALTMLFGPLLAMGIHRWQQRGEGQGQAEEAADDFTDARGNVLVVGFGRFGQVLNQVLLAADVDVTVIDHNMDRIRSASSFGFKVYYGDGTRLDVLRAAGAEKARLIAICVDGAKAASTIAEMVRTTFPHAQVYVRAYDRTHAIDLMNREADYVMRETFESALAFGTATLVALGEPQGRAVEITADVRKRDIARLAMQRSDGLMAGAHLLRGPVKPEPLTAPKHGAKALSPETKALIGDTPRQAAE